MFSAYYRPPGSGMSKIKTIHEFCLGKQVSKCQVFGVCEQFD